MEILFGFFAGMGLPFQTSFNAMVGRRVGSPYRASLLSFFGALIFLMVLLLFSGDGMLPQIVHWAQAPWWVWSGGLCGVIFLTGNILLVSRLGSAQTVTLSTLGQIFMGMLVDNFGWFHAERSALTSLRTVGVVLVVCGVVLVSLRKTDERKARVRRQRQRRGGRVWLWRLAAVSIGMVSASQVAVNGYLGRVLGASLRAAVVSFAIGTLAIGLLCLAQAWVRQSALLIVPRRRLPLWIWTGGILGALYIWSNITLAGLVGTGTTVVVMLTGSIAGGLLVDHYGFLGTARRPVRIQKVLGVGLMVIGAAAIKLL